MWLDWRSCPRQNPEELWCYYNEGLVPDSPKASKCKCGMHENHASESPKDKCEWVTWMKIMSQNPCRSWHVVWGSPDSHLSTRPANWWNFPFLPISSCAWQTVVPTWLSTACNQRTTVMNTPFSVKAISKSCKGSKLCSTTNNTLKITSNEFWSARGNNNHPCMQQENNLKQLNFYSHQA